MRPRCASIAAVESIPYVPHPPFTVSVPSERSQSTRPVGPTAYTLPFSVDAKVTSPRPATGAARGDAVMPPSSCVFHTSEKPFTDEVNIFAAVKPSTCASWPNDVHDVSALSTYARDAGAPMSAAAATATRTALPVRTERSYGGRLSTD